LAASICAVGVGWASPGGAREPDALKQAFDALPGGFAQTEAEFRAYADFWSGIDGRVIDALNAGRPMGQIEKLLQTLPGYEAPKASDALQIGGSVFSSEPGSDVPTYWITRPDPKARDLLMGVYNHEWNTPGRVSVYSREKAGWVRVLAVDGQVPIQPYVLTASGRSLALATMETFIAADRSEGTLRLWAGRAGTFASAGPVYDRLVNFDISSRNRVLTIHYTGFLEHMCEPVLGTRPEYRLILRARHGHVKVAKASLTPWLDTLGKLYDRVAAGAREEARLLFDHPQDLDVLQIDCPSIDKHGGNARQGWAWARLHALRRGQRDFHVEFARRAHGEWKIARVVAIK
jgi:hypothetical protein